MLRDMPSPSAAGRLIRRAIGNNALTPFLVSRTYQQAREVSGIPAGRLPRVVRPLLICDSMGGLMTDEAGSLAHVIFPLEVDADGWPPVSAERVWARPLGDDKYRLDNAPWFVRDIAEGDVVRAIPPDDSSWPVFVERLAWGGNCTIRVIPSSSAPLETTLEAVLDLFANHGVTGEGAGSYPIVALTIPREADARAVKDLLRQGEADGRWEYEEGCVSDAWLAI